MQPIINTSSSTDLRAIKHDLSNSIFTLENIMDTINDSIKNKVSVGPEVTLDMDLTIKKVTSLWAKLKQKIVEGKIK